jgi:hypothetical protein
MVLYKMTKGKEECLWKRAVPFSFAFPYNMGIDGGKVSEKA